MKARFLWLGAVAAFGVASVVHGEPVKLSKAQLDKVVAGTITQVNGGGNTPNGNANGVPYKNPAGKEPTGWNR